MTKHYFHFILQISQEAKRCRQTKKILKSCHDGSKRRQRSKEGKIRHEKINKRGTRKGRKRKRKEAKQCRKKKKEKLCFLVEELYYCKFFIISTEFDKNISDGRYDCTDYKNDFDSSDLLNGQK